MIECIICGHRSRSSLQKHIESVHKITPTQYKEKYNISCFSNEYRKSVSSGKKEGYKNKSQMWFDKRSNKISQTVQSRSDEERKMISQRISIGTKRGMASSNKQQNRDYLNMSRETKSKISISVSKYAKEHPESQETKDRRVIAFKKTCMEKYGVNNPMKVKEVREKVSNTRSERMRNGEYAHMHNSGIFYSHKNGKDITFRSTYELVAYQILEQASTVLKYEAECLKIPYLYEGILHNYLPDILITKHNDIKQLIEVKPEWKMSDLVVQAKAQAAQHFCKKNNMTYSIWTEKELGITKASYKLRKKKKKKKSDN